MDNIAMQSSAFAWDYSQNIYTDAVGSPSARGDGGVSS
jgi:hypothetical protein